MCLALSLKGTHPLMAVPASNKSTHIREEMIHSTRILRTSPYVTSQHNFHASKFATAGSRTRVPSLEGLDDNRYTTVARLAAAEKNGF